MSQEQPVISLTSSTVEHVKNCLKEHSESAGFRLSVKKSGCTGYAYVPEIVEAPKDTDICFKQDGVNIYVDSGSVSKVKGTVLDYVDSGIGQKQMVYRNPNEAANCGCGESFNVE